MATTTTKTVNVQLSYADYTKRNYKIPWKDNNDVTTKIKAFNTAASDPQSTISQTFLSENGAAIVAITDASTVIKTEEEIYHA